MRLIDEIILCDGSYKDTLKILLDKIEMAETINVPTPSVRYNGFSDTYDIADDSDRPSENDFCSFAERKDND